MSSHHFVREDQEPALLIAGPVSYEAIVDLLEWAPYIMVTSPLAEVALSWGIKLDLVLDNTGLVTVNHFPFPVEVVDYQGGMREMLAKAVEVLAGRNQENVHIALEKAESLQDEVARYPEVRAVLLTEKIRWYQVTGTFEKWVPAGAVFIIENAGGSHLTMENLVMESGAWIVPVEGIIRLTGTKSFWLGESR